jgi:hypothetical protein
MSNPSKPICYDCEYFKLDVVTPQCWHPDVMVWNPIYGDQPSNAEKQRREEIGLCGADGKLFLNRISGALEVAADALINDIIQFCRRVKKEPA